MKNKLLIALSALIISCATAKAVDLNEIQKLKEMGFTNEQIVEMTKSSTQPANNSNSPTISKERIEHLHRISEHKRVPAPTPKEFIRD